MKLHKFRSWAFAFFLCMQPMFCVSIASAQKPQIETWKLNDGFEFKGYPRFTQVGAIGVFRKGNKIKLVQVLYRPTRYGVMVEYKVPGWVTMDEYVKKNGTNKICIEYVYLQLEKRFKLKPANDPLADKLVEAMKNKQVTKFLNAHKTKTLWAYVNFVEFLMYDGTTSTIPLRMFENTPHWNVIEKLYKTEAAKTVEKQKTLINEELAEAFNLQQHVLMQLPMTAFGPSWMGLSPFQPKTRGLMQAQQKSIFLIRGAQLRSVYLAIMKNAM